MISIEEISSVIRKISFYFTVGIKRNFISKEKSDASSPELSNYRPIKKSIIEELTLDFFIKLKKINSIYCPLILRESCDEFSRGSSGLFSEKKLINPETGGILGGSSSGSAFNLLSNKSDISICSDTGGSARFPVLCSKNRLVGFKPSYDKISREGLIEYVSDFDTVSLMTTINNKFLLPIFYKLLLKENSFEKEIDLQKINTITSTSQEYFSSGLKNLYQHPDLSQYYQVKSKLYCWSNIQRYDGKRFGDYTKTYSYLYKPNPTFLKNGEIEKIYNLKDDILLKLTKRLEILEKKIKNYFKPKFNEIFNKNNLFLLRKFKGILKFQNSSDGMTDDKGLFLFVENK